MTLKIRDDFGSIVALVNNEEVDICTLFNHVHVYNNEDMEVASGIEAESIDFDFDFDRSVIPTDTYIAVEVEDVTLDNVGYPFKNHDGLWIRFGWFVISLVDTDKEVA